MRGRNASPSLFGYFNNHVGGRGSFSLICAAAAGPLLLLLQPHTVGTSPMHSATRGSGGAAEEVDGDRPADDAVQLLQ